MRRCGGGDYPSKPITIVVSLAAGTGMDVVTRLYAEKLSQALSKPVIVENKPGAATTLAANQVANAPADGFTLVVLTSIALSINPTLYKHLNYDPADFVPISLYVKSPFILSTYPGLPAKTVPGIHQARQGKQSAADIRVDRRRLAAADVDGVRQEAVRLRGNARAVSLDRASRHRSHRRPRHRELPGSRALDPADQGREAARAGGVGVAAAAAAAQHAAVLRSLRRADYEGVSWHMLLMPAKTPRPIAEKVHAEMKRIMAAPDMREKIAAVGLIPNNSPSIEEMRGYIASEHVKWGALVKQLGLEGSQ